MDAYHCTDGARFISVLMLSLQAMLQLELPHVNVLSKIDVLATMGPTGPGRPSVHPRRAAPRLTRVRARRAARQSDRTHGS